MLCRIFPWVKANLFYMNMGLKGEHFSVVFLYVFQIKMHITLNRLHFINLIFCAYVLITAANALVKQCFISKSYLPTFKIQY